LDRDGDGQISTAEIVASFFDNERIQQFIALSLTGCVIYETIWAKTIDATTLVGIYGTILGFYFKGRG